MNKQRKSLKMKRMLLAGLLSLGAILGFAQKSAAQSGAPASQTGTTTDTGTTASTPTPAATQANAGTASAKKTNDTVQLNTVVVQGISPDQTVLPTAPTTSVYGLNTTIQDTPRVVSQITPEQFSNTNIQSLDDFVYYAPGVTAYSGGGVNASPVIRGQGGAVYTNGFLNAASYQESIPFNNNAYQSANIVSGPATVLYGPTPFTSGYIDYTTKQPYFDGFHGTFTADLGKWDSGGQGGYPDFKQTIDFGAPIIKDELAYRVSLQNQEADSYYQGVTNNQFNGFTALSWIPNKDVTVDWNLDFGDYSYNETSGINRVNQALLDNNSYIGGPAHSLGGAELYTLPAGAPTQKIYGYETLTNGQSPYSANDLKTQLKATDRIDDDFSIVNTTDFESLSDHKVDYVGFYQYNNSKYVENKTEAQLDQHWNVGGLDIEDQSDSGLDLRYENVNIDWDISDADLQAFDLTSSVPITPTAVAGAPVAPNTYNGTPATPGSTYRTWDLQSGLFTQHILKFGDQWTLILGARGDVYTASSYDPLNGASDSSNYIQPSINSSLSYKPVSWATAYLTYDYSQAYDGGGGPGWNYLNSNNQLGSAEYHADSQLYEAGGKFEVIKDKLFANVAGYYQERNDFDSFAGTSYPVEVHGVDASLRYQPDRHLNLGINYSFENAHYQNYNPALGAFNGEGVTAGGAPFGNIFATNIGVHSSSFRVPWVPDNNVSAFAEYKFDFGLGLTAKLWAESDQTIDYTGLYKVAPQYNVDLGAYYDQPHWRVQIDFLNVTDTRVWEPVFGASTDNVLEGEPFGIQGRLVYKF